MCNNKLDLYSTHSKRCFTSQVDSMTRRLNSKQKKKRKERKKEDNLNDTTQRADPDPSLNIPPASKQMVRGRKQSCQWHKYDQKE